MGRMEDSTTLSDQQYKWGFINNFDLVQHSNQELEAPDYSEFVSDAVPGSSTNNVTPRQSARLSIVDRNLDGGGSDGAGVRATVSAVNVTAVHGWPDRSRGLQANGLQRRIVFKGLNRHSAATTAVARILPHVPQPDGGHFGVKVCRIGFVYHCGRMPAEWERTAWEVVGLLREQLRRE
ncbi:hypothetical protein B0H17DRAFT_1135714 [Mycena rosella]|uniref:Uncharacterized protein n=1 Tax=Mycena rosella TaxID=1033263 RepID=A0AAD7DFF5_MYCRO|nr:hypothetical protein B0H17DRAFT_1135714 [Mycena rosella]